MTHWYRDRTAGPWTEGCRCLRWVPAMNDPYRLAIRRDEADPARIALARELVGGETLLWAGRPKGGIRLSPADALLIPFSLVWGGFAIFWEAMAIAMGAPVFFWIFGLPFVGIGLYMMVGRFFVDARRRARTFYGVTDRRVIFVESGATKKVTTMGLLETGPLSLSERVDGSGSIAFGKRGPVPQFDEPSWPTRRAGAAPGFHHVPNVREAFQALNDAQDAARARLPAHHEQGYRLPG